MEEKFYVDIKDDYGKVRSFEVPTLEMKIAIDNIDKELKKNYRYDALKNAIPFLSFQMRTMSLVLQIMMIKLLFSLKLKEINYIKYFGKLLRI